MRQKFFLSLIFLVILSIPATAFLISPAKIELTFEPNAVQTIPLQIVNNALTVQTLEVSIQDYLLQAESLKQQLRQAITVDQTAVTFQAGEAEKSVTVQIRFPAMLSSAGTHEVRVAVTEAATQGHVGSRASNVLRILITVPQQYAMQQGAQQPISVPAQQPTPTPVQPMPLPSESMPEEEPMEFAAVPEEPEGGSIVPIFLFFLLLILVGAGTYFAPLLLTELRNKVVAMSFFVQSVRRGQIGKILVLLDNKAHLPAQQVTIEILIRNSKRAVVHAIRPAPFTISPLSRHRSEYNWETSYFPPDNYIFELAVHYHKERLDMVTYAQVYP